MDAAMGMMGLGIVLTLRDQASRGLEALRGKLLTFKNLTEDMVKTFDVGVKQIMGGFGMMWAGTKTLNVFNNTFGASVKVAASFEQAMARVKAVAGASEEMFERLSSKAKQLGRDTQFTSMDAASALETIIRAGQRPEQALKSVDAVLQLAAADGLTLAESANIISESMNMFGKKAEEATDIANLFAQASRKTSLDSRSLAQAMRYAGTTAKSMDMSMEETVTWIAALSNAGLKYTKGGTQFSGVLDRLVMALTDPKKLGAVEAAGIKLKDAMGKALSPREMLKSFGEGISNMDVVERTKLLKDVFGAVNKKGAFVLSNIAGEKDVEVNLDALFNTISDFKGAAGDMSDVMTNTLPGAMKRLESATEALDIAIGDIFKDSYRWVIEQFAGFKRGLASLIESFPILSKLIIGGTGALVAFAGAALTAGGALLSIKGLINIWPMITMSLGSFARSLPIFGKVFSMFQGARSIGWSFGKSFIYAGKGLKDIFLTALKAIPGPIKVIIALAGALYAAWKTNFAGLRDMFTAISTGWKMMMSADENGIAQLDSETAEKLRSSGIMDYALTMFGILYRLRRFWEGLVEGFTKGVDTMKAVVSTIWEAISGAVSPIFDVSRPLLEMIGFLRPAENTAEEWHNWGVLIGQCAPWILAIVAAVKAWTAAQWLLNTATFSWPGTWIILGIAGLIAAGYALYKNWDKVKAKLIAGWNIVWNKIKAFGSWIKSIAFSLWDGIVSAWDWVKGKVAAGWEWVKGKVVDFWNWLKGFFSWQTVLDAWEATKNGVHNAWEELKNWIAGFIPDWIKNPWDVLVDFWNSTVTSIQNGWEELKAWIAGFIPDWLANPWEALTSGLSSIDFSNINMDTVKEAFEKTLSGVWGGFTAAWDTAVGLIESGWNKLKDSFLGDWAAGAWDSLKNGASAAWETIKSGWDTVANWIGTGLDNAWSGIVAAWDWMKDVVGMGDDPNAIDQKALAEQLNDITILNKMSQDFKDRVAEMTAAWEPFKASLAEGFQNIFNVMLNVGKHIRTAVISAVNELVSSLSRLATGLSAVGQAAGIKVSIPQPQTQPDSRFITSGGADLSKMASGGILTQPQIVQVAEEGPEAIIPLTDPSRGIPLMTAAAGMMGLNFVPAAQPEKGGEGIATRYLARMSGIHEAELVGSSNGSKPSDKPIQIKNDVNMKVEAVTTPVYLDGRLFGEFITRFAAHEAMREGALAFS